MPELRSNSLDFPCDVEAKCFQSLISFRVDNIKKVKHHNCKLFLPENTLIASMFQVMPVIGTS